MREAIFDVWKRARLLVRGRLLKPDTWELHHSIYGHVQSDGHMGEVGATAPHAALWELEGVKGPIHAKKGEYIFIVKRGSKSNRSKFGVIKRRATYTKVTYKKPVAFLRTALMDEMTGAIGRRRLEKLGLAVGYAVLVRYMQRITMTRGPVTVNATSGALAVRTANISREFDLGLNVTAPASGNAMMNRAVRRSGAVIRR